MSLGPCCSLPTTTVTASLSALDAFHYFGLSTVKQVQVVATPPADAGDRIVIPADAAGERERKPSGICARPGLWAMIAIAAIGAVNLLGPKHSSTWATFAAGGHGADDRFHHRHQHSANRLEQYPMGLPAPTTRGTPGAASFSSCWHSPAFEAISNLTGVMRKPVVKTARKAIWAVTLEVAIINLLLAGRDDLALPPAGMNTPRTCSPSSGRRRWGPWGEWARSVSSVACCCCRPTNTAVNGLMSICYVMSRDGELPAGLQKLNGFGSPWVAALVATGVPIVVLLFAHNLTTLASLYAIGRRGRSRYELHPRRDSSPPAAVLAQRPDFLRWAA